MHPKIAYTMKEAVAATGISRTMLYALIKAGELSPVKIGTRTLLRHIDLEALVNRKRAA